MRNFSRSLIAVIALNSIITLPVYGQGTAPAKSVQQTLRLPDGLVGEAYEQPLEVRRQAMDENRLKWAIMDGELPPGLSLNEDGSIVGTPEDARKTSYVFRVKVSDVQYPARSGSIWCTLLVRNPVLAISLKEMSPLKIQLASKNQTPSVKLAKVSPPSSDPASVMDSRRTASPGLVPRLESPVTTAVSLKAPPPVVLAAARSIPATASAPAGIPAASMPSPASTPADTPPSLSISVSHNGTLAQGKDATYTITVNNTSSVATSGAVTVTESLPPGLTLKSMAGTGTGWTCPTGGAICTNTNALGPGNAFPAITAVATVAADAGPAITNTVAVSGGGSVSAPGFDTANLAINCTLTGNICSLDATSQILAAREAVQFQLTGAPAGTPFTLTSADDTRLDCRTSLNTHTCKAGDVAGRSSVLVTATYGVNQSATTSIMMGGTWEGRAIIGYHQAGAASSDFAQNVMVDIYAVRPLGSAQAWKSRVNSWGNVRIASAPRQLNTPLVTLISSSFATGTSNPLLNTNVNELALSGEFQTGLEVAIKKRDDGRVFGAIAFMGASGSFQAPSKNVNIFKVPLATSAQWAEFHGNSLLADIPASTATNPNYVGFTVPDRDRFYRQWGLGFRYSKYNPSAVFESPQTYSVTFGKDEAIGGGQFKGWVTRIDGFWPLPLNTVNGRWNFLYLFGTASLRLGKAEDRTPLVLEPGPTCVANSTATPPVTCAAGTELVQPYAPNVYIRATPSNRDNYRIGFGVDLVNLLRSSIAPH